MVAAVTKIHGSPYSWAPAVVAEALGSAGFAPAVLEAVLAHGVTGDLLCQYETSEELQTLSVTSLADIKRMDLIVKAMSRTNTKSSFFQGPSTKFTPPSLPASEHELFALRELDRYGFTQSFNLLQGNARLATWWFNSQAVEGVPNALHLFDQHPGSAQFSWLVWLIFPEWMAVQHVSKAAFLCLFSPLLRPPLPRALVLNPPSHTRTLAVVWIHRYRPDHRLFPCPELCRNGTQ